MKEKHIKEIIMKLQEINWNFSDYNSTKYPLDLNSIPWYPATFIPPIPKMLIASLSKPGDKVLDPFGGKGTTTIETLLQDRIPIYNDLNPFAIDITQGLLAAINYQVEKRTYLQSEKNRIMNFKVSTKESEQFIADNNISSDVFDWFHPKTLAMLLSIFKMINEIDEKNDTTVRLIRKLALTSILKPACSQPGHFTYVTDNCKPREKREKDALTLYLDKIEQIYLASNDFLTQYKLAYPSGDMNVLLNQKQIVEGDAKKLDWIEEGSIDLVVTSPPYLCAQDYIKTMRLTNFFFENKRAFTESFRQEIGPRSSRKGKSKIIVPEFYNDMNTVFGNIYRVLKDDAFFCLVIGQGKSKITSEYKIIDDLSEVIQTQHGFKLLFQRERKIGNRVIQVGGVDKEVILIYRK